MRGWIECRSARRAPSEGTGDAIGCVGTVVVKVMVVVRERSCGPPRGVLAAELTF